VQGGQQADVALSHAAADSAADAVAAEDGGGGGADAAAAAAAERPPPAAVPLLLRADSAAALLALRDAVARIAAATDELLPRVVSAAVAGDVCEADVQAAADAGAHILAYGARVPAGAARAAERARVRIVAHRVIYTLLDDACAALAERLPAASETAVAAVAEVRQVFALNANRRADPERVAGCLVLEGTLARAGMAGYRVTRGAGGALVAEVQALASLMHFKEKVESVKKGDECGLSLAGFNDLAVGDRIVALKTTAVKRKLEVRFD